MTEPKPAPMIDPIPTLTPDMQLIVDHFCQSSDHGSFGDLAELCESRYDCITTVVSPDCGTRFVVDDDELAELRHFTETTGQALVCGVRFD